MADPAHEHAAFVPISAGVPTVSGAGAVGPDRSFGCGPARPARDPRRRRGRVKTASRVFEAEQVEFSYGPLRVLRGLTLAVEKSEIFGILGANGAGKTTLLRMPVGLLKPASGSIRVFGAEPSAQSNARIGYMPQQSALYQELSARQNVDFFARMYGLARVAARRAAVDRALDWVELGRRQDDPLTRLSGGMRQRVSLAVALVHAPELLILDEPTVGLDPELRATFWGNFSEMAAAGTTLIISSHTMDDAAHCHRLAFIRDGRTVALGTPAELRAGAGGDGPTLEDAFLHFARRGDRP